jgi:hypothetical protein
MTRRRLLIAVQSILIGWAVLLLIGTVVERPLLGGLAPVVGPSWSPTLQLALNCCAFAATGWAIGYRSRTDPLFAVLSFAVTLTVWDFTPLLPIDVPWLFRLVEDTLHDARFFDSLITSAATHALLFGSLITGALLARPAQPPASIFGGR